MHDMLIFLRNYYIYHNHCIRMTKKRSIILVNSHKIYNCTTSSKKNLTELLNNSTTGEIKFSEASYYALGNFHKLIKCPELFIQIQDIKIGYDTHSELYLEEIKDKSSNIIPIKIDLLNKNCFRAKIYESDRSNRFITSFNGHFSDTMNLILKSFSLPNTHGLYTISLPLEYFVNKNYIKKLDKISK